MKFKSDSFLEQLYFGRLDRTLYDYREIPAGDTAVTTLTEKFRSIMQDYPPDVIEKEGRAPQELLDRLSHIGFFGLTIPTQYGGLGLSLHQYAALVEEITKIDMGVGIISLAHLSIGIKGIMLFGSDAQKNKYLTAGSSGSMIFCYALTEPLTGSDAKHITTKADLSSDGGHYILNGTKTYITNANYSGAMTVFAQLDPETPGTLGAFIVETAWEGVSVGKDMDKMGLKASSTASVRFTDVRVPKENMLGKPGDGFKIAMTVLNYGRLGLGAASAGMLDISCTDMLKRAQGRMQFGAPIISFEIIQEKIVRAHAMRDAVRAMTHFTAQLLEKNPLASAAIESSHTKLFGTTHAWDTLYDAQQTAGGAGFLKSQPYEKRMRDFRVATIFEGTTEIHSIYPPLSLARSFSRVLKGKSALSRFSVFLSLKTAADFWRIPSRHDEVNKAHRLAKEIIRAYRKLFLKALAKHGKNLADRELLLRRLTTLSCLGYALMVSAARISFLEKEGQKLCLPLASLAYFTEIADDYASEAVYLDETAEEKAMKKVMGCFNE